MTGFNEWFRKFISSYRAIYAKSSQPIQSRFKYLDNFNAPCQVLVIWLADPDIQIVYVTKDSRRDDGEILSYGPIKKWEALDVFENILKLEWMEESLPKVENDPYEYSKRYGNYRNFLEDELIAVMKSLPYWGMLPPRSGGSEHLPLSKMVTPLSGFKWMAICNILTFDPDDTAREVFEQAQVDATRQHSSTHSKVDLMSKESGEPISGFSTFFYPPVWIGKIPILDFRQKVQGLMAFPPREYVSHYKGRELKLDQRGKIFIGERDKEKCKRFFNEIMASVSILQFPVQPVNENDMGETIFEGSGSSMTFPLSTERYSMAELSIGPVINEQTLRLFRESSEETVLSVIKKAEEISENQDVGDALIFYLYASNHFRNTEYIESFTMSWVIVEKYLNDIWRRTLVSQGLPPTRVNKLSNRQSIDYVIEHLDAFKLISRTEYEVYMKLKNTRNEISHQGYQVLQSEASNCLEAAEHIVKKRYFS